uniref:ATP synthase complex subunit 8 n=1 Tax=Ciidae sp. GENSP01 TaxID=1205545 RepID=A0A0S2MS53_9CUCU|nr:ATP synthase F0 subunit 8 [Ciidae sp. GENSP01]
MPQMSPLNWLNLMISFMIIMMLITKLNYFSFSYLIKSSTKIKKTSSTSWKW